MRPTASPIVRAASAWRQLSATLLCLAMWLGCGLPGWAQVAAPRSDGAPQAISSAPVVIDGHTLFVLRGSMSYPAQERAERVRQNIIAAARDKSLAGADIHVADAADRTQIFAGKTLLLDVLDVDGEFEGIGRRMLASTFAPKIAHAIDQYRSERSRQVLVRNTALALAATVFVAFLLWAVVRVSGWMTRMGERRLQRKLRNLENKAHRLIRAEQVWALVSGLVRGTRALLLVLLVFFYLNAVLGLYPWTRPAALVLFDLVLNPLQSLWNGFIGSIPGLVFLAVLFVVVRYVIGLTRVFFEGVEHQRIRLQNFEPEWAPPTFKILRFLIIAFGVVIAYPYIPGSETSAFKGVSLFLGVIFSLGSSSFISNMVAGLAMTYRGAFKLGELIKIGDAVGAVDEIRLMTTRLRTLKNEIAIIPNSSLLNATVINYSALARSDGLVLHAQVGIGYDVPWREVESMLLQAVERTEGLQRTPRPFVLQLSFGDFAVNYQVNAYCGDPLRMLDLYSALHGNIQDVFNEHGVEIMTPVHTQLLPAAAAKRAAAAAAARPE